MRQALAHAASLADYPSAQLRPHTSSMLPGTGQQPLGQPTAAPPSCPLPALRGPLGDVPYKRTQPLSQTVPRPNTAPIPLEYYMGLVNSLWASAQLRLPAASCPHSVDRPASSPTSARSSLADYPSAQLRPHTSSMLHATGQQPLGLPTAAPPSCPLPALRGPPGDVPYKRTQPLSQTVPRPNTAPIPLVYCMGLVNSLWASAQLRLPAARCPH